MSLGGLGIGLAGVSGAFDADKPEDRQLDREMNYTLDSEGKVMPKWLDLEREFLPQWNDLSNGEFGRSGNALLATYGKDFAPALRDIERGDRQASADTYAAVAPTARSGARALNPEAAALMDKILAAAGEQVSGGMSAGELRDVQQGRRGAQASRGVGYGPSDTFDEVYGVGLQSRQLRQQAVMNALQAISGSQQFYDDPMRVIFGGDAIGSRAASSAPGMAATRTARVFDPQSGYAERLFGGNYAGKNQVEQFNSGVRRSYGQMVADAEQSTMKAAAAAMGGI